MPVNVWRWLCSKTIWVISNNDPNFLLQPLENRQFNMCLNGTCVSLRAPLIAVVPLVKLALFAKIICMKFLQEDLWMRVEWMCIIIIKIDCLRARFTQKARECLGSLSLIKNCVCVYKIVATIFSFWSIFCIYFLFLSHGRLFEIIYVHILPSWAIKYVK